MLSIASKKHRQLACEVAPVHIDLDWIQMGSVINSGSFASGQGICFGSLDFAADSAGRLALTANFIKGQAFHLGSLDFVADRIGKLHIRDSVSS